MPTDKHKRPSYRSLLARIRKEATAELECVPEDLTIEGNALDSGDPDEDRKQEQWIRDQLDSGNEWAWCCAHVEIAWRGFTEHEYLGACSYLSREHFIECGELATMRDEACIRLADRLHKEWETISAAMTAPFGQEKTIEDHLARARWEREQANAVRSLPYGNILASMHERAAIACEQRATELTRTIKYDDE